MWNRFLQYDNEGTHGANRGDLSGESASGSRSSGNNGQTASNQETKKRRTEGSEYPGIFRGPLRGELSPLPIFEEDDQWNVTMHTEEDTCRLSPGDQSCTTSGPALCYTDRPEWQSIYNRSFLLTPPRSQIVHDVYEGLYDGSDLLRISRIHRRQYGGAIYIVCQHNGHYHVVHDCSDGRNGCRCARLQSWRLEFGKQRSRRIVRTATVTSEYWENITNYFQNGERKIIHLEIAGREWISSDSSGRIRLQECYRQGRIKLDTLYNNSLQPVRNNIAWHTIIVYYLYRICI